MAIDLSILALTQEEIKTFGAELAASKDVVGARRLVEFINKQGQTINSFASGLQSRINQASLINPSSIQAVYDYAESEKKKSADSSKVELSLLEQNFPKTVEALKAKVNSLNSGIDQDLVMNHTGGIIGFASEVKEALERNSQNLITEATNVVNNLNSQTKAQQQAQTPPVEAQAPPVEAQAPEEQAALEEMKRVAEKRLTPYTATARDKQIYQPIEENSTSSNDHNLAMFRFAGMVNNAHRKEEITASLTNLYGMGAALKIIDEEIDPRDIKDAIEREQAKKAIAAYNQEMDSIAENIAASYGVSKEEARKQVDTFIGSHKLSEGWFSGRKEGEYGSQELFAKINHYNQQIDNIANRFAVGTDGKVDLAKLDAAIEKLDTLIGQDTHSLKERGNGASDLDLSLRVQKQDNLFALLNDGKTNSHLELQNSYSELVKNLELDSQPTESNLATAEAMRDRLVAIRTENTPVEQSLAQESGKNGGKKAPKAEADLTKVNEGLKEIRTGYAAQTNGDGKDDAEKLKVAVAGFQKTGVMTNEQAAKLTAEIDKKFADGKFFRTEHAQIMQGNFNEALKGGVTRTELGALAADLEGMVLGGKASDGKESIISSGDTRLNENIALAEIPENAVAQGFTPPQIPQNPAEKKQEPAKG